MDIALLQDAAAFAARAHRNQTRKDGRTPYVAHAYRVSMIAREVFGCTDSVALAAALLHDTIEDTTTDYDDLEEHFGAEVAELVATLTKNMALPEAVREAEYDARLAGGDWRARLVKLADVYDNYCDLDTRPDAAEKRADMAKKCRRAINLARAGVPQHPEIARAISAVEALLGAGA